MKLLSLRHSISVIREADILSAIVYDYIKRYRSRVFNGLKI